MFRAQSSAYRLAFVYERRPTARFGRRLALLALLLIALYGWSPLGNAIILPLEERFPPWDPSRGTPAGIVVLGGALDTVVAPRRNEVSLNEAAERMTIAVDDAPFVAGGEYGQGPINAPGMEPVVADINSKLESLKGANLDQVLSGFDTNAKSALGQ